MDAENNITINRTDGKLRGARSEVRTDSVRTKQFEPYRPRGSQDIPPQLRKKLEDEGYHVHWIRVLIDGQTDSSNLADVVYKGYEPVDVRDVPENILKTVQISDVAGYKGLIVSKDSALFKIPQERYDEIREFYRKEADGQLRGVNETVRQNAKVHGLDIKLFDESESHVAVGKDSRKVVTQNDASDS